MKKIPNTDKWQPKKEKTKILGEAFQIRCKHIEQLILQKVEQEIEMNIYNFDSGVGVEDIIREEFSKVLPQRYNVTKGIINDRNGYSAGDVDLIIFNNLWFPAIKYGATRESRRFHYPIEGVYSIGEIKQKLNLKTLDDAMKKLVIASRLERPRTKAGRVNERVEMDNCIHKFTNPLFKFIIVTDIDDEYSIDDIFDRFVKINKTLKRTEIINALCILGKVTFSWSYFSEVYQEKKPALFCNDDMYTSLIPSAKFIKNQRDSALYHLLIHLMNSLYFTVLAAEDIPFAYGNQDSSFQSPNDTKYQLTPDPEWLDLLKTPCPEEKCS